MCDEIVNDLVNDAIKGIASDKKRIEENEQFRQEIEAILFVCNDLTPSVGSAACVNAITSLNGVVKKYKSNE